MKSRLKGTFFVIASAVIFGFVPLLAMTVYNNGGNSFSLALLRTAIPLPVLLAFFLATGRKWKLDPEKYRPMFILSLSCTVTPLLLFSSYSHIPSGMATTLHFTYPVFVVVGSILFCRERPTFTKLLCVCLCTAGIVLFYTPGGEVSAAGILMAFVSGIVYAFYIIYLSRSGLADMDPLVLVFWQFVFVTAETFLFLLLTDSLSFSLTPQGWGAAAAHALVGSLLAVVLFQSGVARVGPQQASILSTFEPITSIVVGILFFQEPFGIKTALGSLLILAAVILLTLFDKEKEADF